MDSVLLAGICLVVGAVIGFIVGVFVYRNNESLLDPIADRIDAQEDNLRFTLRELKDQVETLNKKVSTMVHKAKEKI